MIQGRGRWGLIALFCAAARAQEPAPEPYPESVPVAEAPSAAPPPAADEGAATLDEITVTAQKRGNEAIKDVPISISVVDEHLIADWGITTVRDAMLFVPNVKVEEAGFFMSPRIRGFTTNNNNKSFEPPAGLAIDGIPYGRVEYFNAGLFDVGRIEVLRGPQGTTFGKNTTAGLIHIITRDPTEDFQGFVDFQGGDYDRRRIEAGAGGTLVDGVVNFRIAGVSDERRGFIRNTTHDIKPEADEYLRGQENSGGRVKLAFPDLLGGSVKLTYDRLELGSNGTGMEAIDLTPSMEAALRKYDPNADFIPGNGVTSLDTPDGRKTKIDTGALEAAFPLGAWSGVILGGHSVMDTRWTLDTDFSPAPAIIADGSDVVPTTTFEVRGLSSTFEGFLGLGDGAWGDSDILLGAFYQRSAIEDGIYHFLFPIVPFLDLTLAAESSGGSTGEAPGGIGPEFFGLIPPAGLLGGLQDEVTQHYEQDGYTIAGFTQVQWHFLPQWTLQLAGRYSVEEKEASWRQEFNSPPPNAVVLAGGLRQFDAVRERSDSFFQPKVSLNWQPTGELSLFVHWARSFKAGGFNAFAYRGEEDELVFEPEYTNEWGVDLKGTFFSRTLKLNLSAYRMEVDDFQVLTREPQPTTIGLGITKVENAAQALAQGVEGDIIWLAADWLRFFGTLGFNDTEYLDFKINDCPADMDNTDGDDDVRCDATGKAFAFAPRWNGTMTIGLMPPWRVWGIDFQAAVTAEYNSRQYLDIDLDERKVQESFWRWRASLGFGDEGAGWSFKVIGENLTDERTYFRQGDLAPRQFVGIPDPPRMIFGQLRWTF